MDYEFPRDLDLVGKLAREASPAPWTANPGYCGQRTHIVSAFDPYVMLIGRDLNGDPIFAWPGDTEFVLMARNAVPVMTATIRRLVSELETARAEVARLTPKTTPEDCPW